MSDDINRWINVLAAIEVGHQEIHRLPEATPEDDTLFIALTLRDVLLIGLALPVMELSFPCMHDASLSLQERLVECSKVQRPEWSAKPDSPEDGE